MRCDVIARGIVEAAQQVDIRLPLVVRLEGTNAIEARQLLEKSTLDFIVATSLSDAAEKSVAATKGEK